ncbi:hypothetical protein [Piscinibacter terrae]|nr:hypothetical protein [Albitalea terrae]
MDEILLERAADNCQPDSWHRAAPLLSGLHIDDDAQPAIVTAWLAQALPSALRDARLLVSKMAAQPWRIEVVSREHMVVSLLDNSRWNLHLHELPEHHVHHIERADRAVA